MLTYEVRKIMVGQIDVFLRNNVIRSTVIVFDMKAVKDEEFLLWIEYELKVPAKSNNSLTVRFTREQNDIKFIVKDIIGEVDTSLIAELHNNFYATKDYLVKGWSMI